MIERKRYIVKTEDESFTIYQEIYMKIYIKPEQLTFFLELVGYDNINKMEFYGITEDNQLEKVSLEEIELLLNNSVNE